MKRAIATTFGLLCMAAAQAQTQPSLNLDLPSNQNVKTGNAAVDAADAAQDAPGKYDGDASGNTDLLSNTEVHGSFTSTIGYSKGYGTGFSNAADLNVSSRLKNGGSFDMNISVMKSDGLPTPSYRGYR